MKILFVFFLLLYELFAQKYQGKVINEQGKPIAFAKVRVQNSDSTTYANRKGYFSLIYKGKKTDYITASKDGYLIGGKKFHRDVYDYTITLHPLPKKDNINYNFTSSHSKNKDPKSCQQCHSMIFNQWQKDIHSKTSKNSNFNAIFEDFFKKDFSNLQGNCKNCHKPLEVIDSKNIEIHNEGINCDFCHKIHDVKVSNPNLLGTQRMNFLRPFGLKELLFGSMDDVFPRNDAYVKLYEQSKYCASCHDGKFWNELVYSEYQEWKKSSYPKEGKSCQTCHMPTSKQDVFIANKSQGGFLRDKLQSHSHKMKGSDDKEFMKSAVAVDYDYKIANNKLNLDIKVTNKGAGHHFPTSSPAPFRYVVLKVSLTDENGNILEDINKSFLPTWTGYENSIGKVFAKVFTGVKSYSNQKNSFSHEYPELFWKPISLEYDSRIAAKRSDTFSLNFETLHIKKIYAKIILTHHKFTPKLAKQVKVEPTKMVLYEKRFNLEIR